MGTLASVAGGELLGEAGVRVVDVTHDSRSVTPGSLYVAIPGVHQDGHDYIADARARGAAGLCVSRAVDSSWWTSETPLPVLTVTDTRRALAVLAAEVQGHPSLETAVVGVTGTNGKTTVTHMIESIGVAAGRRCGLIGTVVTRLSDRLIPNPRTTPEASDFQRLLRWMVEQGAEMVACEVSSHALALGRVDATRFAVGAFTNLSQDHLDFHHTMEEYFEAKAGLIERAERRVVWVDDAYGARLVARFPDALTAGWHAPDHTLGAAASAVDTGRTFSRFRLGLPTGTVEVRVNLPGRFNVANAVVAAACAHLAGFSPQEIGEGLERLRSVPGRFEMVSEDDPVTVVVDYAHTPEGIATVIDTARTLSRGRVVAVVGAGGDRDQGKRSQMGRAASAADLVIVTSDNPRSEDPELIIDQVVAGIDNPAVVRVVDRREAIRGALAAASAGDLVLILGKGHESGQEIAGVLHPFDDRVVAREELDFLRADRAVRP
jgi:UDP-N-acetylmuramoyl-L-alanyl-D-glutamate--2,6-diaminopimelate ligase